MSTLHVLLLGGGTGGHIYPLVAVSEAVRATASAQGLTLDVRYFGDPGAYSDYLAQHHISVSMIASSKLRRYFSLRNFLDIFKFVYGFLQALVKLYFFMPEVVFSKGGPGVLPIVYAARWYRIPVVVHESDAVPGLTTRATAKHAAVVELAFAAAQQYFANHKKVQVVGLPVRGAVINGQAAGACRKELGLTDEKPIIFVVGGSQGAQVLNEFVMDNAHAFLAQYEVVHQVGQANFDEYKAEFEFTTKHFPEELKKRYRLFPFLSDEQMAYAFGAADLVISRAGSALFEIAANGKPSILVPLLDSANNHQFENAYAYAGTGAAVVVEEPNLLAGVVFTQIEKLLEDSVLRDKLSKSAKAFYKPEAAHQIARDIIAVSGV